MKTDMKKTFLTKEECLSLIETLEFSGYKFNGDIEYWKKEYFDKEIPEENDLFCTIPIRYMGWNSDEKLFFALTKFMLVSKKDIEKALENPILYSDLLKMCHENITV